MPINLPLTHLNRLPLLGIGGGSEERRNALISDIISALEKIQMNCLIVRFAPLTRVEKQPVADTVTLSQAMLQEKGESKISAELFGKLHRFTEYYDLVILDTDHLENVPAIRFGDDSATDQDTLFHYRTEDDLSSLLAVINLHLKKIEVARPIWGCILIGGKSSRMGRPKHLIEDESGITWVEKQVAGLADMTNDLVLSGKGELPASLHHVARISDVANAEGPLAGILAVMRWNPQASWLVCACDMPLIDKTAISWLLEERKPGRWGVVPRHPETGKLEPLFAYYDARCRNLFETLVQAGEMRLGVIAESEKIHTPVLPTDLAEAWKNCNTPDDVANLGQRAK